jgi:hypothetical protein
MHNLAPILAALIGGIEGDRTSAPYLERDRSKPSFHLQSLGSHRNFVPQGMCTQ